MISVVSQVLLRAFKPQHRSSLHGMSAFHIHLAEDERLIFHFLFISFHFLLSFISLPFNFTLISLTSFSLFPISLLSYYTLALHYKLYFNCVCCCISRHGPISNDCGHDFYSSCPSPVFPFVKEARSGERQFGVIFNSLYSIYSAWNMYTVACPLILDKYFRSVYIREVQ